MKIIINNTEFSYNIGCKLLKAKYKECPQWFNQPEIWDGDLYLYSVDTEYEADEQREAGFTVKCLEYYGA